MITLSDLRAVPSFKTLTDEMLQLLLRLATVHRFEEGEIVYEQGTEAVNFHIMRNGKALLEVDLTSQISVTLASLKPGYLFGMYALTPNSRHAMRAVCSEPSDILTIPGVSLIEAMDRNHDFGYAMMGILFRLLKSRLDRRTEQFLKILGRHPDLNF